MRVSRRRPPSRSVTVRVARRRALGRRSSPPPSPNGWSGLECLSGIPGSAGATPIQNVGAYGQEVAETDHRRSRCTTAATGTVAPDDAGGECGFAYRASVFKHSDRWRGARRSTSGSPGRRCRRRCATPNWPGTLGVEVGDRVPLARGPRRGAGAARRQGHGARPGRPDTRSVGSFFTNPVLDAAGVRAAAGPRRRAGEPPAWPAAGRHGQGQRRLADRARPASPRATRRGRGRHLRQAHPGADQPRRHGTTADLLDLAREIRDGVHDRFGVDPAPRAGPDQLRDLTGQAGRRRIAPGGTASRSVKSRRGRRSGASRGPRHGQLAEAPARGRSRTGQPASRPPAPRAASAAAGRRSRTAPRPARRRRARGAGRAPAHRARCGGSAPSAAARRRSAGGPGSASRAARVSVRGPAGVEQQPRRRAGPARRRCPRPAHRRGRARRSSSAQAAATAPSSYWRSTLNARTSTGRSPASSNPPRRERQPAAGRRPAAAAAHPRRVDLQPDHPTSGADPAPAGPAARRR